MNQTERLVYCSGKECYLKYLNQPHNFGTFMVNAYLMLSKTNPKSAAIVLNAMKRLMTSDNSYLDLPSISKLFMLTFDDIKLMKSEEFQPCFGSNFKSHDLDKEVSSVPENFTFVEDFDKSKIFDKSPCQNRTKYPECANYCLWYEDKTNKLSKDELLDLMR